MTESPRNQARRPYPSLPAITGLLFWSGFCALVYQIAWQREFRLVFGASTAASAAVLAIFMGGLGAGSLFFGRLADRFPVPLSLYARLEGGIAALAAASPFLLRFGRQIYVGFGGMERLGPLGGTLARLLVASIVVLPATFLMGGTLPSASRAIENDDDTGRRRLALVYGINTLGAVAGGAAGTFFFLEILGTRNTIWFASLINALVAVVAQNFSRKTTAVAPPAATPTAQAAELAPTYLAGPLIASATVGFAFFLMELVWYRMLAPLLGGTIFAFGTILVAALIGIGIGGLIYSLAVAPRVRSASIWGFSLLCTLEALMLLAPFALGDRIAILVLLLKPLSIFGFAGHLTRWAIVCLITVVPVAIVSGIQFPWLVAMMGHGRKDIGRHVGAAYAFNTVGAVIGALAGGFGLLPWLSAQGCWRFGGACLVVLGTASAAVSLLKERRTGPAALAFGLSAFCCLLFAARGPTAVWRSSQIGVGREVAPRSPDDLRTFENAQRAQIVWSRDGVESNVALSDKDGLAFIVNGKIDGNSIYDADMQVMSGLLGAILRPNATRALIVGLGTGSTAGWLAAVPNMKRVDVDELEPAILDVARACHAVNHEAMNNPTMKVHLGDARELVLTSKEKYDIVLSEPSNPFRAGVASLFSKDFYESVSDILTDDGVFLQWIQGYEVDSQTVESMYATLTSTFPEVETWQASQNDLLLVGFKKPHPYQIAELDRRTAEEPFRSALRNVWHVQGTEGLLSHYVARPSLAKYVGEIAHDFVSTDDQNFIEYGFAHSMSGVQFGFRVAQIRSLAQQRGEEHPEVLGDRAVDWSAVEFDRSTLSYNAGRHGPTQAPPGSGKTGAAWLAAYEAYLRGDYPATLAAWRSQPLQPHNIIEEILVAESMANQQDPGTLAFIDEHLADRPVESNALRAVYFSRQDNDAAATESLQRAFVAYRTNPWAFDTVMRHALHLGEALARVSKGDAPGLLSAISDPFAASALEDDRRLAMVNVVKHIPNMPCQPLAHDFEPNVPWTRDFLTWRLNCYVAHGDPLARRAAADMKKFVKGTPTPFLGIEKGGEAPPVIAAPTPTATN